MSSVSNDDGNENKNNKSTPSGFSYTFDLPPKDALDYNGWANWYRQALGLNVISSNTVEKKTFVNWEEYQHGPISDKQHKEWLDIGEFQKGTGIIAGLPFHRQDLRNAGLIYTFVDIDSYKSKIAFQEFFTTLRNCEKKGQTLTADKFDELVIQRNYNDKLENDETYESKLISIEEIAKNELIDYHADNITKYHHILLSTVSFDQKSSDQKLGLEVKCQGSHEGECPGGHGLLYCTPSIHKNEPGVIGEFRYQHLVTHKPNIWTKERAQLFQDYLHWVCKKYKVSYHTKKENIQETKNTEELQRVTKDSAKRNEIFQLRDLSDHIIDTTAAYLQPFWLNHSRNNMALSLAGMGWYAKVSLESIIQIVQKITAATLDEESSERIKAVIRTYKRGINGNIDSDSDEDGPAIRGAPTLKDLISQTKGCNSQIASSIIDDLKGLWENDIVRQIWKQKEEEVEAAKRADSQQQGQVDRANKLNVPEISVEEALAKHKGMYKVRAIMTTRSDFKNLYRGVTYRCTHRGCTFTDTEVYDYPLFETKALPKECPRDKAHKNTMRIVEPDYASCLIISLRNPDELEKIDTLSAILFEADYRDIYIGETLEVIGDIHVIPKKINGTKESDPETYLFINQIKSKSREKVKLTEADIEIFNRIKYEQFDKEFRTPEYMEQFPQVLSCRKETQR